MYRATATDTRSPGTVHRQSRWLAGICHCNGLWPTGVSAVWHNTRRIEKVSPTYSTSSTIWLCVNCQYFISSAKVREYWRLMHTKDCQGLIRYRRSSTVISLYVVYEVTSILQLCGEKTLCSKSYIQSQGRPPQPMKQNSPSTTLPSPLLPLRSLHPSSHYPFIPVHSS